jgi:hypothetical protein
MAKKKSIILEAINECAEDLYYANIMDKSTLREFKDACKTKKRITKVVYNACYGGFGLSRKAAERLLELGVEEMDQEIKDIESAHLRGLGDIYNIPNDFSRHDSRLVQVIEEMGSAASGSYAKLQIAKVKGKKYIIEEYDGYESVKTPKDICWIKIK